MQTTEEVDALEEETISLLTIEEYVADLYRQGKSPYEIAQEIGPPWYPVKVRRLLVKLGTPLRGKSAAQSEALKSGRATHPTEGKNLSAEVKEKISRSVAAKYQECTPEEKNRRSKLSSEAWARMTPEQKSELSSAATKAILKAAEFGSKMERYLVEELRKLGYAVDFHPQNFIPYHPKLECDILITNIHEGVVCEIDGPTHSSGDLWGEEAYEKTHQADLRKNSEIMTAGLYMIRVQTIAQKITQSYCRKILVRLTTVLEKIKNEPLQSLEGRFIFIEDK